MNGPLAPVWAWYEMARDSLRVATRVVEKSIPKAITRKHVLHGLAAGDATSRIRDARYELDNLAVVAMVAVFERTIREYLTIRVLPQLSANDTFDQALREQVVEDIEYWHISSRVIDGLFKHRVDPDLCGRVKQIIDYRNKVAHGHVRGKPPPANMTPASAYERLALFLGNAGVISPEMVPDTSPKASIT